MSLYIVCYWKIYNCLMKLSLRSLRKGGVINKNELIKTSIFPYKVSFTVLFTCFEMFSTALSFSLKSLKDSFSSLARLSTVSSRSVYQEMS